ncbi:MAG: DUF2071 domain-containing protein [Myxococcaceae bacterium]|nr:DUF2071 domain-containing protein [Myxococcaceae bacterium]
MTTHDLSTPRAPFISADLAMAYQRWHSALLVHWPVPIASLRPLLPKRLALDTFGDEVWVTAVAYTVTGSRMRLLPPLPGVASFHACDLRTYVQLEGDTPGVWFFSRDATNAIGCALGRLALRYPCFMMRATRSQRGDEHRWASSRLLTTRAELSARWRVSGPALDTPPGSFEEFVANRKVMYSSSAGGRVWAAPVRSSGWQLFRAELLELEQSIAVIEGVPPRSAPAAAHYMPGADIEFLGPRVG